MLIRKAKLTEYVKARILNNLRHQYHIHYDKFSLYKTDITRIGYTLKRQDNPELFIKIDIPVLTEGDYFKVKDIYFKIPSQGEQMFKLEEGDSLFVKKIAKIEVLLSKNLNRRLNESLYRRESE